MAITLTSRYIAELKKNVNRPNSILEFGLDSGIKRFAAHGRGSSVTYFLADGTYRANGSIFACGSDELPEVLPVLKSVSSLQNKIDPKSGYSTRGQLTAVITGRENFRDLVRDEYLMNRRVTLKCGFISPGFTYVDYASTFSGIVTDWSRKGDDLTITVSDDLVDASIKIPTENSTGTQYVDYSNIHPVDIINDILVTQLGIDPSYVDSARLTEEGNTWLNGWRFNRIITEPKEADSYLNEIQVETNSFVVHDGEKITYKVFSPPVPGIPIEEWTDNNTILKDSFSIKSGYKDNFYNRVLVYFDYDESGSDKEENYETAVIAVDAASQTSSEWNEISTRTIKSKWIRNYTFSQTSNITGITIYHASKANGAGIGSLTYNKAANTLQWAAPNGAAGTAVTLSNDGKYQLYDQDASKYLRVIVTTASLPSVDAADTVSISAINGTAFATTLASKILSRYRDPVATISLDIDINNVAFDSRFIKPTDLKDITTDEAFEKGAGAWSRERVMLTSVRPDLSNHKVGIEGIETRMYRTYAFIAPSGYPDYPLASASQREYAFIGDSSNKVNSTVDGYYIW